MLRHCGVSCKVLPMREKLYHVEVLSRTDSEARVPCILPVSGRHLVGFEELLECSLECKEEEWLF